MRVVELWRYPVKSARGEQIEEVVLEPRGLAHDRCWGFRDTETGLILTARRAPSLLEASAAVVDGDLRLSVPEGVDVDDPSSVAAWLGRPATLVPATDDTSGTYEIAIDSGTHATAPDAATGTWDGDWVQWRGPRGRFHDSTRTAISIIGTASLGTWDAARFRPNVVVDGDERDLLDTDVVRLGAAEVVVKKEIDRCVIVTRPQPGLARDLGILETVNRTRSGNLGVGALVRTPATIRVGDQVTA